MTEVKVTVAIPPDDQIVPAIMVNLFVIRAWNAGIVRIAFAEGVQDKNSTFRSAVMMTKTDAKDLANSIMRTLEELEEKQNALH